MLGIGVVEVDQSFALRSFEPNNAKNGRFLEAEKDAVVWMQKDVHQAKLKTSFSCPKRNIGNQ